MNRKFDSHSEHSRHEAEGRPDNSAENEAERHEADHRASPSGRIVYRAIHHEGEQELERSTHALFFSGLAAGLSMGFSMITQGLLAAHLPQAAWTKLVAGFGYSIGFLIVILGRQQLFTENTLTPMLPLLQRRDLKTLGNVLRLWLTVLVANLLGGCILAWIAMRTPLFDAHVKSAFIRIGLQAFGPIKSIAPASCAGCAPCSAAATPARFPLRHRGRN